MISTDQQSVSLPPSSSNFRFNLLALVLFFLVFAGLIKFFPHYNRVFLTVVSLLALTLILWIFDFCGPKVYLRPSTRLTRPGALDPDRYLTKLTGLFTTFGVILFLYWANPFYRDSPRAIQFYGGFFSVVQMLGPWLIALSVFYFAYIDRRQKEPYDTYWHMGCLLLGRWKQVKAIYIQEHARVWFIKAFFAPFMFGLLIDYLGLVFSFDAKNGVSFLAGYNHLLNVFYSFDVLYGFLGYFLTLRLTDTHIQSTEPKLLGWLACLACYHPFYQIFGIGLLKYQGTTTWDQWFYAQPVLFYTYGVLIIVLSAIYGLATVAFGYRMSNLTYRGIITDGPYRFTKHPAYLAKVSSWWLISLPFLSTEGSGVALAHTLSLIVISVIYYLRAKTEENHLVNYPEYVQYAQWIDEHGIFSPLKKRFPALRFSVERSPRNHSIVWFKKIK